MSNWGESIMKITLKLSQLTEMNIWPRTHSAVLLDICLPCDPCSKYAFHVNFWTRVVVHFLVVESGEHYESGDLILWMMCICYARSIPDTAL
jgi:hypothetical protein